MKKSIPVKVYQFIITDSATGKQEIIDNCLFSYYDGEAVEIHTQSGDVLTYSTIAVNIKRA